MGAGPNGAAAADGGLLAVAQDLRKLRKPLRENKLYRSQLAQVCGLCIYTMDDQRVARPNEGMGLLMTMSNC